jgi:DNA polymerase (family 10)
MPNVFSQIVSMRGGCYQALATFRSGYKVSCTFLAIRASEWPFALLKYTGPEGFWQRLQKHAELKGMRLTQQSLTNSGVTELCKTENDIFKSLGLTFIPPSKRY